MTDLELVLAAEEMSGVGGWMLDTAASRLQWTAQTFRLHGLAPGSPQPSMAQALALLVPPDAQRLADLVAHVLARGLPAEIDLTLLLPGGQPQRLHLTAQPVPGKAGQVQGTLRLQDGSAASPPMTLGPLASEVALAAAGVGVWGMDLETGEEVWDERTLQIYGLPAGSAAPSSPQWHQRFLHPDDAARVTAAGAEFGTHGRLYELDYRIRRADDGAVRWVHSRASYAWGGTRHVLGITLDITPRKLAEERAQEAWHALDVSATQVGFGFGYRDAQGGGGEWSAQLKRMVGLQPDDPTPSREGVLLLAEESERERLGRELLVLPGPGEVHEFEYSVRLPDGTRRQLMTRAMLRTDGQGRPWRYYFVVIDVTETRARNRRVAELLERLKMATEASGIGTWERDPAAERALWDDTTLALFGLPPGSPAPTGQAYLSHLHADDRERVAHELDTPRALGQTFEYQFRVCLPDGRVRWLCTRGCRQGDALGQGQRRVGICFDITERREAEAALQAKELAERANAAKTEFLSRMSHELRTPLNAVLGFAQLLMLDAAQPLSESQQARVAHIQNAGWHLLALINDVLDLTRIESRQAQIKAELVPLAEVVDECLAMNAAAAAQRGIRLQALLGEPPLLTLWADRTRLKQVLLNLLSNAIKYNRQDGWVHVRARQEPTGEVSVLVQDSGLGLTPGQLGQLFEPFNRLGREQGTAEGTGIGLTLSKLIAEQMGGRLQARSEAGVGSEFCLTLPAGP